MISQEEIYKNYNKLHHYNYIKIKITVQENVCKTIILDILEQKNAEKLLRAKNTRVKDYIMLKY